MTNMAKQNRKVTTMTERPAREKGSGKPTRKGAPEAKHLISAASLAAILTGWAIAANHDLAPAANPPLTLAQAQSQPQTDPSSMPDMATAPLPTFVPLIVPAAPLPAAPPDVPVVAPIELPGAAVAPASPPLRVVTVPAPPPHSRAPVAVTRSSR